MKVKFWVYTENLYDGSCASRYFDSKAAAEHYASFDDERFCDDINLEELEFDENGKLVGPNPIHYDDKGNHEK